MKMRDIISDHQNHICHHAATGQAISKAFMEEMIALCRKHNLCLVPSNGGRESWHDSMILVPLCEERIEFINRAIVYFDDDAVADDAVADDAVADDAVANDAVADDDCAEISEIASITSPICFHCEEHTINYAHLNVRIDSENVTLIITIRDGKFHADIDPFEAEYFGTEWIDGIIMGLNNGDIDDNCLSCPVCKGDAIVIYESSHPNTATQSIPELVDGPSPDASQQVKTEQHDGNDAD